MAQDAWDPRQYERFKAERAQPFFDLLAMIEKVPIARAVDLGCGTGELTKVMHETVGAAETIGVDSSKAMLEKSAAFAGGGLRFEVGEIECFSPPPGSFDLVFSNAAIHWVADHSEVFARLAQAIAPGGQLAVQMPANHEHASHTVAAEVAELSPFAEALGGYVKKPNLLEPEAYARLLYRLGFARQRVRVEVYGHVLPSREGVIEWVRGTTLTDYEKRLDPALYSEFLNEYRRRLFDRLAEETPYFFPFRRILIWAQSSGRSGVPGK